MSASLKVYNPEPYYFMDAAEYLTHLHGDRVEVQAVVRVRGLWRIRWADRLIRLAGRLLRAKYSLKTIEADV